MGTCPKCRHLVRCICGIKDAHRVLCEYRVAALLSMEIPCTHGFQACPVCDPCKCGLKVKLEGIR